jgi:hypothetical protein
MLYSQAGGAPFVGCPRPLIQYIGSYLSYLEAVSPILNLRKHHAAMTTDQVNMVVYRL